MLVEMFPYLGDLAKVCLAMVCLLIPVGTAFLPDKNKAEELSWRAKPMTIAIETPEKLPDDIVVNIWNRKPRHIIAV